MHVARRAFLRGAIIGGASLAVGACSSTKTAPVAAGTKPMKKFTYLTGFGTTPRECYPYVGLGMDFFAEAGIDLTIQAGKPSTSNLELLAAGRADFAAVDFVSAVLFASDPKYKSTVVMAVQHPTLLSVLTLPGRGIGTPQDLAGKTIGAASETAASRTVFTAFAGLAGVDAKKVNWIYADPNSLPALLATDKIQAMSSYAIDVPVVEQAAKGVLPIVLPYSTFITDLYGTVIVCRKNLIDSDPDSVKAFTGAMWRGITYAVNNWAAAGTLIHKAVPTTDAGISADTMLLMRPSATSPVLERDRVERGIVLLEGQKLLTRPNVQPDDVVAFGLAPAA